MKCELSNPWSRRAPDRVFSLKEADSSTEYWDGEGIFARVSLGWKATRLTGEWVRGLSGAGTGRKCLLGGVTALDGDNKQQWERVPHPWPPFLQHSRWGYSLGHHYYSLGKVGWGTHFPIHCDTKSATVMPWDGDNDSSGATTGPSYMQYSHWECSLTLWLDEAVETGDNVPEQAIPLLGPTTLLHGWNTNPGRDSSSLIFGPLFYIYRVFFSSA